MGYRVIDLKTKEDITDKFDWVITPDGKLFYLDCDSLTGYEDAIYILELDYERFCINDHSYN